MGLFDEPSPSDWERWELALADGQEPSKAARDAGFTCSAFRRHDADRHREALELSREVREGDANELGRKWALSPDADPRLKLAYLKAESARYRQGDTSKVEVTGREGAAIAVEGRTVVGLLDVVNLARELDLTGPLGLDAIDAGAARAALPAPGDVLPDPAADQQAAGALSPAGQR